MQFGEILQLAEDASFVHPDGKKVPAVVHTAIYKKSSSGNDMLSVTYRITGGPNAGKGRPIRHYIMFDRDTGKQIVCNLGFPAKDFDNMKGMSAEDAIGRIAAVVVGKPCAIDIESETFNERLQNKVKWAHPPQKQGVPAAAKKTETKPSEDAEPEDDEEAELERKLAEKRAAKAAAAKPSRSAPPDDLPF